VSSLERVLFVSGTRTSATLRYRVRLAEEALRSRGVRTAAVYFTEPSLVSWAKEADVVALYRTPINKTIVNLIRDSRERHVPVTFDVDDRVFMAEHLAWMPFLSQMSASDRMGFEQDLPRRGITASLADRGSGTTDAIVDDLGALIQGPVRLLPNGVGRVADVRAAEVVKVRRHSRSSVRLGYFSGSATHDADWAMIEADVLELMRADPRIELWLVGPIRPSAALEVLGDRIVRKSAVSWLDLFDLLAQVDINLAPLDPSPFTLAKSAIKWLESALVATPTVATATPPFEQAVHAGYDGVLVTPGKSWIEPVAELVYDPVLREMIGRAARAGALTRYGPEVQADRYLEYFRAAVSDEDTRTADAERSLPTSGVHRVISGGANLESYPFEPQFADLTMKGPFWASTLHRVRAGLRRRFARGARFIRRGLRKVKRLLTHRS
jgi:glycosyltransferase involved in cell wall biosynthesis